MARYVVTNRRAPTPESGRAATALDVVSGHPAVTVVGASNPRVVTIETDAATAEQLKRDLADTHFVEPEIRRGLT
jgi:hypothetical protein